MEIFDFDTRAKLMIAKKCDIADWQSIKIIDKRPSLSRDNETWVVATLNNKALWDSRLPIT